MTSFSLMSRLAAMISFFRTFAWILLAWSLSPCLQAKKNAALMSMLQLNALSQQVGEDSSLYQDISTVSPAEGIFRLLYIFGVGCLVCRG